MPTNIELTLEQLQEGVSNDVLNISVILFSIHYRNPSRADIKQSLRIHKDGDGDASFQLKSDSLPHAHAHSTKTFYKHQDSRIMKAQELKTKTSANSDINDNSSEIKLRGRLLESFQDDAKYEHVGQDTRSQGGKDVKDKQG
ncbi:hypothetical protein Tco_0929611 [Tanacetum coccineum]